MCEHLHYVVRNPHMMVGFVDGWCDDGDDDFLSSVSVANECGVTNVRGGVGHGRRYGSGVVAPGT